MTTSIDNPCMDFEINVGGTLNLLEAVRQYNSNCNIIYSSTNKVYGDLEQYKYNETETRYTCVDKPNGYDESTQLDFHLPYGCSKGAADQYMLDYARIFGLNTVVFRHSSMYGGRQFATYDQGWVGWFCQKAVEIKNGINKPFTISGNGKQVRDVLHAEDMISLYFTALANVSKIRGNAFNIGGTIALSIIVLQTDYIVMSQKLSAADIIKYTVTMKIFGLMFFIYTAVLQALWPVCAELRVKMQWRKLHRIIFLNIIGGVFFIGLGTLFIYVLKDYIYSIIANGIDYNISEVVFVLLAVYFSIRVWCDTFAMLLQSMNQLKILWLIVPCQALIGGVTQWYFAEHYGIVGILYGLILSFSLTVFWGLPVYYMYKSKRLA